MKARLWEFQKQKCNDALRSLVVAPEMQTLSASHCTHNARASSSSTEARRRRRGGAATSDSLITNHSYSLLLLNSISRRPTRSNRCLRGGGWRRHSLQQLLSRGAWRREEAPEVSRRRLQAAPGWRPSKHNPRPERRSPRQRATRRAPKFS